MCLVKQHFFGWLKKCHLLVPASQMGGFAAFLCLVWLSSCDCVLRYTPEQMYNVVASVDQYQHFVPWCKKSRVVKGRNGDVQAELEIGFPPIMERYTSEVTVVPNHQVRVSPCLGNSRQWPLQIPTYFLLQSVFLIKAHFLYLLKNLSLRPSVLMKQIKSN